MENRKIYLGPLTDNRRWDQVRLRPDDVIVVTPPKCGTTWMQTIVSLLLSGDPNVEPDLKFKMPWVDIRLRNMAEVSERLEAMTSRRSMKSHTPLDGLPIEDRTQYFCVFRHPLDAHISFRNHIRNIPMPWFQMHYPEPDSDGAAFRWFLEGGAEGFDGDGGTLAHILRHYRKAKAQAARANVTLFHYADMKRDLSGTFAQVAKLIGVSHPDHVLESLITAASFDHMKAHADRYSPTGGMESSKSETGFFHSGKNGQWRDLLSAAELEAYEAVMTKEMSAEDRDWLEYGAQGPR